MLHNTTATIREFGEFHLGISYVLRLGGYAIAFRGDGLLAVIQARGGYYLPGGGQDQDESAEQAAVREAYEECGLRIRVLDLISVADQLVYGDSERTYFRKRCTFVTPEVISREGGGEDDHHLLWMPPDEASKILSHGSQRWAVTEASRTTR